MIKGIHMPTFTRKSLLALAISTALLSGCNDDTKEVEVIKEVEVVKEVEVIKEVPAEEAEATEE